MWALFHQKWNRWLGLGGKIQLHGDSHAFCLNNIFLALLKIGAEQFVQVKFLNSSSELHSPLTSLKTTETVDWMGFCNEIFKRLKPWSVPKGWTEFWMFPIMFWSQRTFFCHFFFRLQFAQPLEVIGQPGLSCICCSKVSLSIGLQTNHLGHLLFHSQLVHCSALPKLFHCSLHTVSLSIGAHSTILASFHQKPSTLVF